MFLAIARKSLFKNVQKMRLSRVSSGQNLALSILSRLLLNVSVATRATFEILILSRFYPAFFMPWKFSNRFKRAKKMRYARISAKQMLVSCVSLKLYNSDNSAFQTYSINLILSWFYPAFFMQKIGTSMPYQIIRGVLS